MAGLLSLSVCLFCLPLVQSFDSTTSDDHVSLLQTQAVMRIPQEETLSKLGSRAIADDADFDTYAKAHDREYRRGSDDFALRERLFHETAAQVRAHNSKPDRRWSACLNTFADRTPLELAQLRGWRHTASTASKGVALVTELAENGTSTHADEVDWRSLSSMKHIANQGACGSCWAVATASMMEARHEIKRGARTFSAQRLVDCVPNPKECGGTGGCGGATVELALTYVDSLPGSRLATAEEAPYAGTDQICSSATEYAATDGNGGSGGAVTSWKTLPSNKAKPLMIALQDGPVAVAASAEQWFSYSHGVLDSCSKDSVIDHAIVMVGYGKDGNTNYWTIRNSWGADWGEHGHIRLLRQATPEEDDAWCGTDNRPEEGMACKPYPDSVTVCGMCGVIYDSVVADF